MFSLSSTNLNSLIKLEDLNGLEAEGGAGENPAIFLFRLGVSSVFLIIRVLTPTEADSGATLSSAIASYQDYLRAKM